MFLQFDRKYVKEKFIADLRKARDSGKGKEPEEMKRVMFWWISFYIKTAATANHFVAIVQISLF